MISPVDEDQGKPANVKEASSAGGIADIVVRTYNSGSTLKRALSSAMAMKGHGRVIVIDHMSVDNTEQICNELGCEYYTENTGLGYATILGIQKSGTPVIVFLDSDVEVLDREFILESAKLLENPKIGAVVGDTMGHPFSYGLPLGLTSFRRADLSRIEMPKEIAGRETYFIQKYMRDKHLKVKYVKNAKIHDSPARKNVHWPEWQGASVRIAGGFNLRELIYSYLVIFLMLLNSRNLKNIAYIPIFQAKFTRGFLSPESWRNFERKPSYTSGGGGL
ncbi:MAG: glycosyltransferase [Thermoplasmataceae archaeon]